MLLSKVVTQCESQSGVQEGEEIQFLTFETSPQSSRETRHINKAQNQAVGNQE